MHTCSYELRDDFRQNKKGDCASNMPSFTPT